MTIVCGTDFSHRSRSALVAAAALAAGLKDAELWLVHALDPAARSLDPVARGALRSAARKRLDAEAAALQKRASRRVGHVVLAGPASDTLLRFAEAKKARLLVVASQGHGASPLYRVGGTSERLAQAAQLPLLVVRDGAPFDAWARGQRPLRVLLAVDWSRSCEVAIRWVKALREVLPCDVVVGHVYFTEEGGRRYGLPPHRPIVERDPEAEQLLARDLAARVGELGGQGEVAFRPRHGIGRLGDHLLEIAEAERVDLIVMGTHHRRGLSRLSSLANVTLHHSRASVAVVPVPEGEVPAPDEVPHIRRVLVATDLSPMSNFAVPFAYTLLAGLGGEVHLFHAHAGGKEPSDAEIAAQLRSLVPTNGVAPNVTTRTEVVRHRNAGRAICEAAERLGVDAICLGSRGRTGLKGALLGSVAEDVMRKSRRPLFVVRPPPP